MFKELAQSKSFTYNVYGGGAWGDVPAGGGGGANGSTISYDEMSGAYTVDPDGAAGAAAPFAFGNPDFNYKSLRGTVVLRWEYRPGSTLYLVWTRSRPDFDQSKDNLDIDRDIKRMFSGNAQNLFLIKASYWMNI